MKLVNSKGLMAQKTRKNSYKFYRVHEVSLLFLLSLDFELCDMALEILSVDIPYIRITSTCLFPALSEIINCNKLSLKYK